MSNVEIWALQGSDTLLLCQQELGPLLLAGGLFACGAKQSAAPGHDRTAFPPRVLRWVRVVQTGFASAKMSRICDSD